jgi:type II secretory pathway pseudopilin PulG
MLLSGSSSRSQLSAAFTLLELSIVVLILSLMLSGILAYLAQDTRNANLVEMKKKMDAIEFALISYSKRSDTRRLPCPANPELALEHADFGFSAAPSCKTGAPRALSDDYADTVVAMGTVPVRTLGLPDSFAFDPWGNRYTYIVSIDAVQSNAFITNPVSSSATDDLNVVDVVIDTVGNYTAAIISHGENGFGAFTRSGIRKNAVASNQNNEEDNAFFSGVGHSLNPRIVYNSTMFSTNTAHPIDDIVRVYPRSFFKATADLQSP